MKVLVVDDVGYARHYHSRLLERFGHQVESAETGSQALRTLERDPTIGVVLTDLMMREMDGVELFRRAQKMNRLVDDGDAPPPAFLLMTALRPGKDASQQKDWDKIQLAKSIGFVDVLFKPIEPDQLKLTLETIKYARGRTQIDTAGVAKRISETVDVLISDKNVERASRFLDELQLQLDRLNDFVLFTDEDQD